ncbi:FUSC family protein [Paraburkholderia sp. BR10937]|uniref:FUSC family protein n=1 Tax=Paraburkholderia sp. BR10937 TaxID=3236994 RepID=UPI0034D2963E
MEEASLSEGMRAACAATAMLIAGEFLHNHHFSWAAIGAFSTCLADAGVSPRRRFSSMVGFTVLSTVFGGLTALAAGSGLVAACAAVLAISFSAGLASIWAPAAYQVALVSATICIVMVDSPIHSLQEGAPLLGIYATGCLVATLLSFSIWRIHPSGPSRFAVRLVYQRLSDAACDIAALASSPGSPQDDWDRWATDFRTQARQSLEAARSALIGPPPSRVEGRQLLGDLLLALDDAEWILVSLIVIATALENSSLAGADRQTMRTQARRVARCLDALAGLLTRISEALAKPATPFPHELRGRLPALARRIEGALNHTLTIRFISSKVSDLALRIPSSSKETTWIHALTDATRDGLQTLRANLRRQSPGLRHAARLCVATTSALVVVRSFHIPFGYWATMATLFVLQPAGGMTLLRSMERAAGSTAGALLAAMIGLAIHSPLAISLAVFPLICLTMGLRRVSYSLYVVFLTPSFVLVADFAKPSNEFLYAVDRLGNNVLGCLAALLATWLIRSVGDRDKLEGAVERAVDANLAYLAAACASPGSDADIEDFRRKAGLASSHAEAMCRFNWSIRKCQRIKILSTLSLLRRILGVGAVIQNSSAFADKNAIFHQVLSTAIEQVRAQGHGNIGQPPTIPRHSRLRPIENELLQQLVQLRTLRQKDNRSIADLSVAVSQ